MNIFDIIGPVMIGPSSSHTAGAARIGQFAHNLLKKDAVKAEILFHGSFGKTYQGHGSDKAIVGGILGMNTDDIRIRDSLTLAKECGLEVLITTGQLSGVHPNTAKVTLTSDEGDTVSVVGESVGGGNIRIVEIDGLKVSVTGHHDTLIVVHTDTPGVVASVTHCLSQHQVNVHNIHLSRETRGGTAILTIEVDGRLHPEFNNAILLLEHVQSSTLIPQL